MVIHRNPAGTRADVVIAGGGVIGCAIAHELAVAGLEVLLLDRADLAGGASSSNPGVISVATKRPGRVAALARASARLFPTLLRRLPVRVPYTNEGSLVFYETAEELDFLKLQVLALARQNIRLEFVDPQRARSIQPLLTGPIGGAVWSPGDAIVDSRKLTLALAAAAADAGAQLVTGEEVTAIRTTQGRVSGVSTTQREIQCKWAINATGVGAHRLGASVGLQHNILPRRGHLLFTSPLSDVRSVRVTSAVELLMKHQPGEQRALHPYATGFTPTADGCVVIGGTNEDAGLDDTADPALVATLALRAGRLANRLLEATVDRVWTGFRPVSSTGEPIIESAETPRGYLVAAGHGGDGVALAPITALYVKELLLSGDMPEHLTLDAFLQGVTVH